MRKDNRERYRFLEGWTKLLRWHVAFAYTKDIAVADRAVRRGNVLRDIEPISAPRVAGLSIDLGKNARECRRWLEAEDFALIHQSIPHREIRGVGHEDGSPVTGWLAGRYTIYWPWSDEFAEKNIHTQNLFDKVNLDVETEWIVGLGDTYKPIVFSIDPKRGSPHFFAIGSTTSGKSTAVVNMIAQLARCPTTRFVFIDVAKKGDGLGLVPYMKNAMGPPAWEIEDARGALGWVLDEMAIRYRDSKHERGRLIIVIDEFPSLRDDKFCVNAIDKIVSQSATANIHVGLIAQHAIEKAIGPFAGIIKSNVSGRLCFKCGSPQNSIQAIGNDAATKLVPPGDAYCIHAMLPQPLRVQASYFPETWLKDNLILGEPVLSEWPAADGSLTKTGRKRGFTGDELGLSLISAKLGNGRGKLERLLLEAGVEMGSTVSRDLLKIGKDMFTWLQSHKLDIVARR